MGDVRRRRKKRTIAARAFTRCYNRLTESILNKVSKDIIITKFDDLKKLWENLQVKHDTYVIAKDPDQDESFVNEVEELWISKYIDRFELIDTSKCEYLQLLDDAKEKSDEMKLKKEMTTQCNEAIKSGLPHRDSLHLIFKQEIKILEQNLKRDTTGVLKHQILAGIKDVKVNLDKCKESQLSYIYHNSSVSTDNGQAWIEERQSEYNACNDQVFIYLKRI